MINRGSIRFAVLIIILLMSGGCTPYVVLTPMEHPVETPAYMTVGAITDQLPQDIAEEDKPTFEEVQKFKDHLYNELNDKEFVEMLDHYSTDARYEVTGEILEYKRGSGAVRFLTGFGLGNARILIKMNLIDRTSEETVFAGSFRAEVGSWAVKGDEMYKTVAKNFAKAVEKQQKKALKND